MSTSKITEHGLLPISQFVEVPLHPVEIGIWLAVSRRRIIRPIFFHETINGQLYREQLLAPFLD
jgi:hypothetical protein